MEDQRDKAWRVVQAWTWEGTDGKEHVLSPPAKKAWKYIWQANKREPGDVWISTDALARKQVTSERSARRRLDVLEEAGLIKVLDASKPPWRLVRIHEPREVCRDRQSMGSTEGPGEHQRSLGFQHRPDAIPADSPISSAIDSARASYSATAEPPAEPPSTRGGSAAVDPQNLQKSPSHIEQPAAEPPRRAGGTAAEPMAEPPNSPPRARGDAPRARAPFTFSTNTDLPFNFPSFPLSDGTESRSSIGSAGAEPPRQNSGAAGDEANREEHERELRERAALRILERQAHERAAAHDRGMPRRDGLEAVIDRSVPLGAVLAGHVQKLAAILPGDPEILRRVDELATWMRRRVDRYRLPAQRALQPEPCVRIANAIVRGQEGAGLYPIDELHEVIAYIDRMYAAGCPQEPFVLFTGTMKKKFRKRGFTWPDAPKKPRPR